MTKPPKKISMSASDREDPYAIDDLPPMEPVAVGATADESQPTGSSESAMNWVTEPIGDGSEEASGNPSPSIHPDFELQPVAESPEFEESDAVLAELRAFGTEQTPKKSSAQPEQKPPTTNTKPAVATSTPRTAEAPQKGLLPIVASLQLEGWIISRVVRALSAHCEIDKESSSPLEKGFVELSSQASAAGGNAVLGMQWQFIPGADTPQVLITGTAVVLDKKPQTKP